MRKIFFGVLIFISSLSSGQGSLDFLVPPKYPTDIPNLKYWYDISYLTGLINGQEILTITDLSGNGLHLIAGSSATAGIYTTNFHNGLPAMAMNGAKSYAAPGGKPSWDWMHQGSSTIFWVVQSSVDNANLMLFDSGPGASASNVGRTMNFRVTTPGSNPGSFRDIARAASGTQIFSNIFPDENTTPKDVILLIVCRYEVGVGEQIYINNVLTRSVNQNNAPTITTSTSNPRFFARNGPADNFNGFALCWFGYNRALTLEEISVIIGGYPYGLTYNEYDRQLTVDELNEHRIAKFTKKSQFKLLPLEQ